MNQPKENTRGILYRGQDIIGGYTKTIFFYFFQ